MDEPDHLTGPDQSAIHVTAVQGGTPALAGRGRAVHVWVDMATGKSLTWPPEVLAKCWEGLPG